MSMRWTPALRARLAGHDLTGSVRLATAEPAPSGTALLTRTHPLTATLAEALVEASLDPETLSGLGIGRVGAWPTAAVQQMTRLALLRIRFKLTVHARKERLLLAEEAALVAIQGSQIVAVGETARELLNTPATADLAPIARDRFIAKAKEDLPGLLEGPIAEFAEARARRTHGGPCPAPRRVRLRIARHGGGCAATGRDRPVRADAG